MSTRRPSTIAPGPLPGGRLQNGLTLVELMVGLTVGMFITLGLLILIGNTSRSYKIQDDFARMQENGVTALRYLGEDFRMAGFYGLATSTGAVTPDGGVTTGTDCGSALNLPLANWALDTQTPLFGFDGVTTATVEGLLPCIDADNFQDGQVLITRSAGGYLIPDPNADGSLSDAVFDANTIYLQADPNSGVLFNGDDFVTLKGAGFTKSKLGGGDAPIYDYQAHVYYIRPCSRPAGATCAASDDDGRPIPTLVRQELSGNNMVEVPLVEGVERMNILYMLDVNAASGNAANGVAGCALFAPPCTEPPDGIPDTVTTAPVFNADPILNQWNQVVAVRVSLLIRSNTPTAGYDDSVKTYDLGNGVTFTCPAGTCNFKRHVFSQTFQVRNLAQRRGA